jgi:hypothetical protein
MGIGSCEGAPRSLEYSASAGAGEFGDQRLDQ